MPHIPDEKTGQRNTPRRQADEPANEKQDNENPRTKNMFMDRISLVKHDVPASVIIDKLHGGKNP